ncbi:MAG: LLM class flavin-dependent oxidoreductase [Nitrolancea sp.]
MGFPLRVGLGTGNRLPFPELARQWQQIEDLGFDSAWVVDHFLAGNDESIPYLEAWSLIASLGVLTKRIRFGILVSGNTYRNPGLLAKQAVTIDHATNGRVEIGIGAGWMEREHHAYSYEYPSAGTRIEMLDEAVQIIDSLMTEDRTTFKGKYYSFDDAPFEPKPLQQPRIPIIIGAFKPKMIKLAAKYADTWNTRGTPEVVAPLAEQFRAAAHEVGRNPDDVRMSVYTWEAPFSSEDEFRTTIEAYAKLGFSELVFPMASHEQQAMMERCARNVLPELRKTH